MEDMKDVFNREVQRLSAVISPEMAHMFVLGAWTANNVMAATADPAKALREVVDLGLELCSAAALRPTSVVEPDVPTPNGCRGCYDCMGYSHHWTVSLSKIT